MKINDVLAGISKGEFDADLRVLTNTIKARKGIVAQQTLYSLKPDDLVRIDNIRPKSICGLTARVTGTNRTTVSVVFGEEAGRHSGPCRVPVACCTPVNDE